MGSIDPFLPWAPPRTSSLRVSDTPPLSLSLLICGSRRMGHRSPEASSSSEVEYSGFCLTPSPPPGTFRNYTDLLLWTLSQDLNPFTTSNFFTILTPASPPG